MKRISLLAILLILGVLTSSVFAQKPTNGDIPVTSIIADYYSTAAGNKDHGIKSDQLGAYRNGVDSVGSVIQGGSDWVFSTTGSKVRKVYFDFSNPVGEHDPNKPAPPSGYYPARTRAGCSYKGLRLQDLLPGTTIECFLNIRIVVGKTEYSLKFNADNFPGTQDVPWICTSTAEGKCNAWRGQSDMTGQGGRRTARLLKLTKMGSSEDYGLYDFSFDISLTNP